MGITIKEILTYDYFKDFKFISKPNKEDREIQGVAILDAPDGFNWIRGKEFVVSSGYIFSKDLELAKKYLKGIDATKLSGLGVKLGRYIDEVPQDIIDIFEEHDIPIIEVPPRVAWMELFNQINVIAMNKSIKHFKIGNIDPRVYIDSDYKTKKIDKILSQLEEEMNFPSMLYDMVNQTEYFSSDKFMETTKGLGIEELINPEGKYKEDVVCDSLGIKRYKMTGQDDNNPYTWITVPIVVAQRTKAYFVVIESDAIMDYFDQFIFRIGFILLQSIYEQALIADNVKGFRFGNFVKDMLGSRLTNENIEHECENLDLDMEKEYYSVVMNIKNSVKTDLEIEDKIKTMLVSITRNINIRTTSTVKNEYIVLIPKAENTSSIKNNQMLKGYFDEFIAKIIKKNKKVKIDVGISDVAHSIFELKKNIGRARKAIEIGKIIYPDIDIMNYSDLGVFAWINIDEEEIPLVVEDVENILKQDNGEELLETLEIYLDCNMNYSHTAKTMYIHINTIRKRIDIIRDLIKIDINDPINKLKLELLMKIVGSKVSQQ